MAKKVKLLEQSTVVTNVDVGQMDLLVIFTRHNKVVMKNTGFKTIRNYFIYMTI